MKRLRGFEFVAQAASLLFRRLPNLRLGPGPRLLRRLSRGHRAHTTLCSFRLAVLCAASVLAFPVRPDAQAVIEGKVILPKQEKAPAPPPRYPGQVGEIALPDAPEAVVSLHGHFPAWVTNTPPVTNQVLQLGMQFRPALLPVRVGSTVAFPNGDDFYHNVFSYSKVKRFDLGRYRKEDKPALQTFDQPGVVRLFCDIHRHMRGAILVLDTPFFARTTNGTYRLENLPPGQYELEAWADENHVGRKPVQLQAGQTLHVDFDLK